jgi:hypothetical protein
MIERVFGSKQRRVGAAMMGTQMAPREPIYDEDKFAELVLYVAKKLEGDPFGGAQKLNKALAFSEFTHYRMHGRPITGAAYFKLKRGPAPRRLLPVRDRLIGAGRAELRSEWVIGYRQDRLVALDDPNLEKFSDEELDIVDQVLKALDGKTGQEVSDLSHDDMGWIVVDLEETIPYEMAFLASAREMVVTDEMRRHAEELAKQLGTRT